MTGLGRPSFHRRKLGIKELNAISQTWNVDVQVVQVDGRPRGVISNAKL